MTSSAVKTWLHRGELERLENVVLEGRGACLLGEHSQDLRTRVFLKGLPNYLTKIAQVHDAVERCSLAETQRIIAEESKKKLAIAKDSCGTPLIHKAVYYDQADIVAWLVENYPITPQQKDKEGRTALHYCAACKDSNAIWDLLLEGGCDASVCDKRGNPAAYYLEHSAEIELPEVEIMSRRRKSTGKDYLDCKPSNIRIWIHNRDIGKLQQVLWEGHGAKLRCETSNSPRIRKFLEAVPFIMGTIKDIHTATINNDLDGLKKKLEEPVSPVVLGGKDCNGLNALHKAAGLGHADIAREILERYPTAVATQDSEGKTPLHYAAALKDDGAMYDLLTEHGADESKLDNRQKAPAFYKNRPSDVDLTNLSVIPDAPRVSGSAYPKNWDWRILEANQPLSRGMKKVISSSSDIDSAFGSAESTTKDSDASSEVHTGGFTEQVKRADDEQPQNEDEEEEEEGEEAETPNGGIEEEEEEKEAQNEGDDEANNGDEKQEEEGAEEGPNDEEANAEEEEKEEQQEEEQEETKADDSEEKASSDDDVVIGPVAEPEKDEEDAAEESPKIEEIADGEKNDEERNDPSTGDSGVDDPAQDEEQQVVGEHEESAEVELDEGSMARDPEVDNLLANGNMEQLAALVLNGEGRRLVGRQSGNPELQAFIDNVPAYMGKIHAVHMAAREGNLRDLQSALDRRKFAVARDESSPHGATPLHVAVVFGNTAVIRYLAGRFPETAHAIDLDGRTPLHYAATLADNGHYYNLLLHLGANPLVQDNFGHKADYYKQNQSDLSHKTILRDFGASERLADEMLMDKVPGGDVYSARRDVSEPETLAILERCFRLLASNRRSSVPKTSSNTGTLVGRCLKRPVFDLIKHRVTRMDHNLFDVIWPAMKRYGNVTANGSKAGSARSNISYSDEDHGYGVVAPDFESYVVFTEFFDPFIRELHCVTASGDLPDHPPPRFFNNDDEGDEEAPPDEATLASIEQHDLDPIAKFIQAGVIECARNLVNYTLPLTLTVNQLEEVEREITNQFMSPEISAMMAEGSSEDEAGTYFTLNEILEQPSRIRAQLAAAGLLLPITEYDVSDDRRLHGKHWPYGRGVYVTTAGDLAAWVNIQDHLRVVCRTNENRPGLMGRAYVRVAKLMMILDRKLNFKRDCKLGFLTARPHALGNTLRFCLVVRFPELSKTPDNLRHLCVVRGLSVRDTAKKDMVRIGNQQSLAIAELQTLQDFSRAVHNIITLEKELSLNNSMKIATLIAGIFRKRANASRGLKA
ncbi:uncharacterized protein LOC105185779 [Harpegnathos saltator]|uniref:uncharacterized protein LOC105185779 n=1 Tax=Harpegnathos saltator TaxID=610380 RepID=UPI0009491C1D|nr:uncharacterized protein LOC105185779 [Harpegnathos saltator]